MDAPPTAAQRQPPGLAPLRERADDDDPATAVTALYHDHAVSLIRLAHVMLGDRAAAEDVVQDAFCGLYRRWGKLTWEEMMITPDGRALFLVRTNVSGTTTFLRLEEYSLRTGKRTRVIAVTAVPLDGGYMQVFWSSPSGRIFVIGQFLHGADVVNARGFRAIPWSRRFITAAW